MASRRSPSTSCIGISFGESDGVWRERAGRDDDPAVGVLRRYDAVELAHDLHADALGPPLLALDEMPLAIGPAESQVDAAVRARAAFAVNGVPLAPVVGLDEFLELVPVERADRLLRPIRRQHRPFAGRNEWRTALRRPGARTPGSPRSTTRNQPRACPPRRRPSAAASTNSPLRGTARVSLGRDQIGGIGRPVRRSAKLALVGSTGQYHSERITHLKEDCPWRARRRKTAPYPQPPISPTPQRCSPHPPL